ncbi:hypothetical protein PCCS19_20910 [Paenibacillus sp. CCS19]|uniref:hypothetical protein n=1 Tax=Paenibacillus sp. CCS19 TaxID=3158387 RepID=UPI00256A7168|nr:hypothetical protein [Paenibacillus cellulosilyticus]GMK39037.1 hypothetical protein PCCS19_20910 [Paenibacillus cellulosilyticus]
MPKLNEILLYHRHPWTVPVVPEIDPDEGFYDVQPWQFPEPVLQLLDQMFTEVEDFFTSNNLPFEVAIYEVKEVYGQLEVSSFTPHPEVSDIFIKYSELSRTLFT